MSLYVDISRKLMKYLREHTMDVRVFSVDEAFVEISWLPEMHKQDISVYLEELQKDILKRIWIPVSIGVSNTRLKAKIFSKVEKPFWICVWIDAQEEREIFTNLSFREIPFIGSQTSKKLDFHISHIQDYIDIWYFEITRRFWKNGWKIWLELRGVSSMGFLPKTIQKSTWRARGFNREMSSDTKVLLKRIRDNLDRLCDDIYAKWYEIWEISLLLIDSDWNTYKAGKTLPTYTSDRKELFSQLSELFYDIYKQNLLYRKTWVFSSRIQSIDQKQLSLFTWENIHHKANLHIEGLLHDMEEKYWKGILRVGV